MKQTDIRLTKSTQESTRQLLETMQQDDTYVVHSSHANRTSHAFDYTTQRTLLPASFEADLKYRLGIQEYFVGRAHVRLSFDFNAASSRHHRARELVLRLNALPVRIVRPLIGQA
jgi:hypothetical protein